MIDYKKKILKYKFKYLNLIKKKNIYGGNFVDGDINVRTFMDILAINIKGLEEHANYNMLERDMAHDFGNNNVPLFQKNHPDAKANSLIGKLEKGTEAHHLLKYIENAEVLLYYVNKDLKWNTGPNQAKENNCIISGDTESRCTMLELYPERINLPDSLNPHKLLENNKPIIHYDTGTGSFWHRYNYSISNSFDSATTKQDIDLIPKEIYNFAHNISDQDIEIYANAKVQQILIFTFYGKIGTNNNQDIFKANSDTKIEYLRSLWPSSLTHPFNYNYELNSKNQQGLSNKNYKLFFIAINILRSMEINIKKPSNKKLIFTGRFKKKKTDYIKELVDDYNTFFPNPIDHLINEDSEPFTFPVHQADVSNIFMKHTGYESEKQARSDVAALSVKSNKKYIEKFCNKNKNELGSEELNETDILRILMYCGLLFKYAFGDSFFILTQLYDKYLRQSNPSYLRTNDNFLILRSLIFNNPIFSEANAGIKIHFSDTIDPDQHSGINNQFEYYFYIKPFVTYQDFRNKIITKYPFSEILGVDLVHYIRVHNQKTSEFIKKYIDKIPDELALSEFKIQEMATAFGDSFVDDLKNLEITYNKSKNIFRILDILNKYTNVVRLVRINTDYNKNIEKKIEQEQYGENNELILTELNELLAHQYGGGTKIEKLLQKFEPDNLIDWDKKDDPKGCFLMYPGSNKHKSCNANEECVFINKAYIANYFPGKESGCYNLKLESDYSKPSKQTVISSPKPLNQTVISSPKPSNETVLSSTSDPAGTSGEGEPREISINEGKLINMVELLISKLIYLYDPRVVNDEDSTLEVIINMRFDSIISNELTIGEEINYRLNIVKNNIENVTMRFEELIELLNFFNTIYDLRNIQGGIEEIYILLKKIIRSSFRRLMTYSKPISKMYIPRYNDVEMNIYMCNAENNEDIDVDVFLEKIKNLIHRVMVNNQTGWINYENINSIFKDFQETYNTFYDNFIQYNTQQGGRLTRSNNRFLQMNKNLLSFINKKNNDILTIEVVLYFINYVIEKEEIDIKELNKKLQDKLKECEQKLNKNYEKVDKLEEQNTELQDELGKLNKEKLKLLLNIKNNNLDENRKHIHKHKHKNKSGKGSRGHTHKHQHRDSNIGHHTARNSNKFPHTHTHGGSNIKIGNIITKLNEIFKNIPKIESTDKDKTILNILLFNNEDTFNEQLRLIIPDFEEWTTHRYTQRDIDKLKFILNNQYNIMYKFIVIILKLDYKYVEVFNKCFKLYYTIYCQNYINSIDTNMSEDEKEIILNKLFLSFIESMNTFINDIVDLCNNQDLITLINSNKDKLNEIEEIIESNDFYNNNIIQFMLTTQYDYFQMGIRSNKDDYKSSDESESEYESEFSDSDISDSELIDLDAFLKDKNDANKQKTFLEEIYSESDSSDSDYNSDVSE